LVERPCIRAKLCALDIDPTVGGERGAIAAHARRRDAIEEIDASPHTLHQILRKADAHQITRSLRRKRVVDHLEDAIHVLLRFANGKSADAETVPRAARQDDLRGIAAKGLVRSEEHTSELQSQSNLVCRLLL